MNVQAPVTPRIYKVAEGLFFGRVFWIVGDQPSTSRHRNDVKSPPCCGWSHAFLLDNGGKLVTLFCPYTIESFEVTRTCYEITSMEMDRKYRPCEKNPARNIVDGWQPWTQERQERMLKMVVANWEFFGKLNMTGKDYDTAARVIAILGGEVPLRIVAEGAVSSKNRGGGKEADDVLGLAKPVNPDSKRGQILKFFLPQPRSIREAMAEFDTTRSNILSHLFYIQKAHGIGYSLSGDAATIILPAGCTDPFVAAKD